MDTYNFKSLSKEIDNTVVFLVQLFTNSTADLSLEECKTIIKRNLLEDSNSYVDYKDNSFNLISILLSKAKSYNVEDFCLIFLSATFLLRKYLNIQEDDEQTIQKIGILFDELFNKFESFKAE